MYRSIALVALLTLGTAPASSQADVVRSARVVAAVPAGAVVVRHGGVRYHLARGVYYRPAGRGFVAVSPPRGMVVRGLPGGAVSFRHRGARYYRAAGTVYRRTRSGYVVVRL